MQENLRGCREQAALFGEITTVSFTIDELRLFLDTHPENREALALFNSNVKRRNELLRSYEEKYGPIEAYSEDPDGWSWNTAPMPWETEGNY